MRKKISKNDYYEIEIDTDKNRFYITHKRFWRNAAVAPNYLTEIQQALEKLKPGFTALQDNSKYTVVPQEVASKLISRAEYLLQNAKPAHTAVVLPEDKVARLVTQITSKIDPNASNSPHYFSSREQAEAWLDNLDKTENE
ncbi:MAG: hypothetical protein NZ551_01285 [Microscillaceae bacterium]|nr:hypothetical protein [Microscillaceae bacterium]MDW8459822.1 hypothetical protein [Cytophagales bacterium]